MSKKKTADRFASEWIRIPDTGTLKEQFDGYFESHKKIGDIINFIGVQNARYIAMMGKEEDISADLADGLIEFYDYFMERFGSVTFEARMLQWGEEPFIFRLAEYLEEKRLTAKQREELKVLDPEIMSEARSLADKIWNIRKERQLTFLLANEHGQCFPDQLVFASTIDKEELDDCYTMLLYDCAVLILSFGSMVARVTDKNGSTEIFGVRAGLDGKWVPISAEDMLDAHTLCPDGTRLEPEEGVTYTSIKRG